MLEIDLLELFKTFPVCVIVLVVIPVAFLTSPACGAHEFKAYRMQHYDLHGIAYGKWWSLHWNDSSHSLINYRC